MSSYLLVVPVIVCMAYVCGYVWRIAPTIRPTFGIDGPGLPDEPVAPPPPPLGPADQAPPVLGPEDYELLFLLADWQHELNEPVGV